MLNFQNTDLSDTSDDEILDIQDANGTQPPASNGVRRNGGRKEESVQQSIINIDSEVQRRPRLASHEYDVSKERKRSKR